MNIKEHIDELIEHEVFQIHGDYPELSDEQLNDIRKRSHELLQGLGLEALEPGWVDTKQFDLSKFQSEYSDLPKFHTIEIKPGDIHFDEKKKSIWNRIWNSNFMFWTGIGILMAGTFLCGFFAQQAQALTAITVFILSFTASSVLTNKYLSK